MLSWRAGQGPGLQRAPKGSVGASQIMNYNYNYHHSARPYKLWNHRSLRNDMNYSNSVIATPGTTVLRTHTESHIWYASLPQTCPMSPKSLQTPSQFTDFSLEPIQGERNAVTKEETSKGNIILSKWKATCDHTTTSASMDDFEFMEMYRIKYHRGRKEARESHRRKRDREVSPPKFSKRTADFIARMGAHVASFYEDVEEIKTQGLGDFLSAVGNLPGNIGNAVSGLADIAAHMGRVGAAFDNVEDLPGSFDKIANAAERYARDGLRVKHTPGLSPMQEVLLSAILFSYFYTKEGAVAKAISFASGIYGVVVAGKLLTSVPEVQMLIQRVLTVMDLNREYHTQGLEANPILGLSASLLMLYQRYSVYELPPDASSLDKFLDVVKDSKYIFRETRNFSAGVEETLASIQDLVNSTCAFMGLDWRARFVGEYWVEIDEMREQYNALRADFEERKELSSVASQAKALLTRLDSTSVKKSSGMYVHHRDLRNLVYSLVSELRGFGAFGNAERVEPFVVLLSGEPGIGKSLLSKTIQDVFARKFLSTRAYNDFSNGVTANVVWAPNLAESFDSGYNNQAIVLIDDLGYSQESNEIVVPKFIQWVNQVPTQTNQASLDRKGAVFFDSKLIVCTTNLTDFGRATSKLATPEAFYRRMHVRIHAKLKPEYANSEGRLDLSKITDGLLSSSGCWATFSKLNPDGGQLTPLEDDFATIVENMLDEFDARMNIHNVKLGKSKAFSSLLADVDVSRNSNVKDAIRAMGPKFVTQGPSYFEHEVPDPYMCPIGCACRGDEHMTDHCRSKDGWCNHCGVRIGSKEVRLKFPPGSYCILDVRTADGYCLDLMCKLHLDAYYNEVLFLRDFQSKIKVPTMVDTIKDTFCVVTSAFWQKCKSLMGDYWGAILLGVTALGIGTYAYTRPKEIPVEQVDIDPVVAQARDQGAVDQGRKVVNGNVVWLSTDLGGQIGAGLAIGGELILLNRHVYDNAKNSKFTNVTVDRFHHNLGARSWTVSKDSVFNDSTYEIPETDLCVVRVEKFLGADIRGLFAQKKLEWNAMRTRQVSIYFWEPDDNGVAHQLSMHGPARGFHEVSATAPSGARYSTLKTIEYDLCTYVGLCGAPVFINDPTISAKLCGIHVAGHGSRTRGYAAVVNRDMIELAFAHFDAKSIIVNSTPFIRTKVRYDQFPENPIQDATVVGKCEPRNLHMKTAYKRSPFANQIPGVPLAKAPAVLVPKNVGGVIVDPIIKNITGYSRGAEMPDMVRLAGVRNGLLKYLKSATEPYNHPGPLSFEDAAGGNKWLLPYLAPINRTTSAGFPDAFFFSDKKRSVFGAEEWDFSSDECNELRAVVGEMVERLKDDPIDFIYAVFPKDELRPMDRVRELKTRMIMASSLSVTVVSRMYFGPFIDWFMDPRNRFVNCSAVGIDMSNESELRQFVNFHHNGSPNYRVFGGDQSGFDKNLNPWLTDIVRAINEEFVFQDWSEETRDIANNIIISDTYPTLAVKDNLILWSNSNPSGCILTTPKNSFSNTFATLQCMAEVILGGCDERTVAGFIFTALREGWIRTTAFGDDIVFSVIRGIHKGWNFDLITNGSISLAMLNVGLKYTDEQKNTEFDEVDRTIFEVSFLKRRIRDSEIGLVAYLDVDTILQNIQWLKSGPEEMDIWHDKLENFLNELSVHPDEVWDKYFPILKETYYRCLPRGEYSFSPTRLERMRRWRTRSLLLGTFCDEEPHRDTPQIPVLVESTTQNTLQRSCDLPYNAAQGDLRLAGDRIGGAERTERTASGSDAEKCAHTQGPWPVYQGAGSNAPDTQTANNDQNNTLAMGENGQSGVGLSLVSETPSVMRVAATEFDPQIAAQYAPNDISTVSDYLNKQVPVADFSWSTSDAVGSLLVTNDSWNFVSNTGLWIEKLRGFYGLRSTLCFRLEINGTPFHAGRLRLCYYPDASSSSEKWRSHVMNFVTISQLPGVEIEANESSVELKIPYITVSRFLELTSSKRSWGRIFVAVASPLATGPDNIQNVNCRLWAWMEDVELFGQTHQFVTQGPKKRLAPADAEGTPVASFLSGSARAVGSLSAIPTVAAYAGPTAWALNAAAGIASAFGWSKPNSKASVSRVSNNPTALLANCNGEDPSHALSLDADAKLRAIEDVSPSGQDEMSINYIKRQWSYLGAFTYAPGSSLINPIYELNLNVRNLGVFVSPTVNFLTPVAYLARMFELFRGGIEVKIKFAKTAVHRGKIQVSYVPGPTPATNTLAQSAYLHRTIVDLAEGGEICIAFPYMLPVDYMSTSVDFGRMYVHAVTSLNAPETVAPSVQCSVYVRAMDDMHFVQPKQSGFVPFNDPIIVQGPNDLVNTGSISCDTVGGAVDPNMDIAFAESSASEIVTSVGQLLKRFVHVGLPFDGFGYFRFYPWLNKGRFLVAGDNFRTDYHSYVMAPYAFFRGGVKLKLSLNNGLATVSDAERLSRVNAWLVPGIAPTVYSNSPATPSPTSGDLGYLAQTEAFGTATALIVQVPYQNAWRMAPNRLFNASAETPGFDLPRGALVSSQPSGVGGIARAFADDFQLLFFVGIPTMAVV